jgi:hypothetical protein
LGIILKLSPHIKQRQNSKNLDHTGYPCCYAKVDTYIFEYAERSSFTPNIYAGILRDCRDASDPKGLKAAAGGAGAWAAMESPQKPKFFVLWCIVFL